MDREELPSSTGVGKLDARIKRARDAQNGKISKGRAPVGLGWAINKSLVGELISGSVGATLLS